MQSPSSQLERESARPLYEQITDRLRRDLSDRNNFSEQVLADVRSEMGSLVYDTVIPRNVRLSEAPSYGKPALLYDLKCAGSQAYLRLATEVIRRERQLMAA